jgi:hypothetical protein
MTDDMLAAVTTAVQMKRGAYTWAEALSYAEITHNLDEYQAEDLASIARNQYRRLEAQTAGGKA